PRGEYPLLLGRTDPERLPAYVGRMGAPAPGGDAAARARLARVAVRNGGLCRQYPPGSTAALPPGGGDRHGRDVPGHRAGHDPRDPGTRHNRLSSRVEVLDDSVGEEDP